MNKKEPPVLVEGQEATKLAGELYKLHTDFYERLNKMKQEFNTEAKMMTSLRDGRATIMVHDLVKLMGFEAPAEDDYSWLVDFRYFSDLGISVLGKMDPSERNEFSLIGEQPLEEDEFDDDDDDGPLTDEPPPEGEPLN